MQTLKSIVKSRQLWTLVLLFVVNGITGVKDTVPVEFLPYLNGFLGLCAFYFRVFPKQSFE